MTALQNPYVTSAILQVLGWSFSPHSYYNYWDSKHISQPWYILKMISHADIRQSLYTQSKKTQKNNPSNYHILMLRCQVLPLLLTVYNQQVILRQRSIIL